jgi:hypothetical protein
LYVLVGVVVEQLQEAGVAQAVVLEVFGKMLLTVSRLANCQPMVLLLL